MFRFGDDLQNVPAQIHMFLDLTNCEIMTPRQHQRFIRGRDPNVEDDDSLSDSDDESDSISIDYDEERDTYLSKSLWCVIQRADIDSLNNFQHNEFQMQSRLASRFVLEDDLRLIPLKNLKRGCFVVYNNPMESDDHLSNRSGFYIHPRDEWASTTFV